MRVVRFRRGEKIRFGQLGADHDTVTPYPASVTDLRDLMGATPPMSSEAPMRLADVELLSPVATAPRNIFCVGKNYREHAREFARSGFETGATTDVDEFPAVFTKPVSCLVGPNTTVDLHHDVTSAVDYEAELALVIGTGGKAVRKADAYRHVWGYFITNDVTARDRQKNHKQWFMGKSLDTFCPAGPWVATADEVDPENLDIKAWVNGELRQSANTRDLIFDIPTLIETLSAGMALLPGDIISTGTPSGVGIGFTPPKFLAPGDVVTISITGLGTLTNMFA